ncbi:MAG: response regulator [bacterium]|nr:response regulator [bacterium]
MKSKILIIDDEKNVRISLKNLLKDYGYQIFLAEKLVEAERILLAEEINLVILDIVLNKEDGLNWLRKMYGRKKYCPTIVISGNSNAKIIKEAKEIGAIGILEKPFSGEKVLHMIKSILESTEEQSTKNINP